MRSFTFKVRYMENANGYVRITEGAKWLKIARNLRKKGLATITQGERRFDTYGGSYDVGYSSFDVTVTEI